MQIPSNTLKRSEVAIPPVIRPTISIQKDLKCFVKHDLTSKIEAFEKLAMSLFHWRYSLSKLVASNIARSIRPQLQLRRQIPKSWPKMLLMVPEKLQSQQQQNCGVHICLPATLRKCQRERCFQNPPQKG